MQLQSVPRVALSFVTRHVLAALTESYNSRASQHQRNSNYGGFKTFQDVGFVFYRFVKASVPITDFFTLHEASAPNFQSAPAGTWNSSWDFCWSLQIWQQTPRQGQQHPISEILPPKQFLGKLPPAAPLLPPPIGRGTPRKSLESSLQAKIPGFPIPASGFQAVGLG